MTEKDYAPLSTACVRGLCDKLYDKRKFAGVEIEKMVKDFNDANNSNQIKRLIRVLGQELMASTNPNVKNGALMGLSSVAVGLGKSSANYVGELTHPILACLGESEARVRYAAVEALFNVLKISRGAALLYFPQIFDALARLAADSEAQVRQGAEVLDRLVKEIVTESSEFEVGAAVPLVRERLYARAAGARQFAVAWVSALDAAPALPLRRYLPDLLDGLFCVLDDPNPEIRRMCDVQLSEFLRSIKKEPAEVEFEAMMNVLVTHAQAPAELLQLTAVTWLKEFLELAGARLLPHASGVLCAALPCLAYGDEPRRKIRETAAIVNSQLIKLVVSDAAPAPAGEPGPGGEGGAGGQGEEGADEAARGVQRLSVTEGGQGGQGGLQLGAVMGVLALMLHHSSVHTKVAALDWILHLYNKLPYQMWGETERTFTNVVACLADPADDVVRRALAVLAEICTCPACPGLPAAATSDPAATASDPAASDPAASHPAASDPAASDPAAAASDPAAIDPKPAYELSANPYYEKFLRALLRLLAADEALLEDRGAFIIRQLCVLLPAEEVYRALGGLAGGAGGAGGGAEARFAARLADTLATILLTAAELHATRRRLRAFDHPSTHELFRALHGSWSHSPVALLALSLLTHNYAHCRRLISTFGDLEITVEFLTEVDKLVQLIESPIFAYLRLELLGGEASAELRGALFALLMLLPQSAAFHALRQRLHAAPHHAYLVPEARAGPAPDIDFEALLAHFRRVQAAHHAQRLAHYP